MPSRCGAYLAQPGAFVNCKPVKFSQSINTVRDGVYIYPNFRAKFRGGIA